MMSEAGWPVEAWVIWHLNGHVPTCICIGIPQLYFDRLLRYILTD